MYTNKISDYTLENIIFGSNRFGYNIFELYKGEKRKISFTTPIMKIPFAIEKYGKKEIVNLEFTNYNDDNDTYNFFMTLKKLDQLMLQPMNLRLTLPKGFLEDISNKTYISFLKEKKYFDPIMRTTYKGDIIGDLGKGSLAKCIVDIDSLWKTKTSYGVLLKTKLIETCDD